MTSAVDVVVVHVVCGTTVTRVWLSQRVEYRVSSVDDVCHCTAVLVVSAVAVAVVRTISVAMDVVQKTSVAVDVERDTSVVVVVARKSSVVTDVVRMVSVVVTLLVMKCGRLTMDVYTFHVARIRTMVVPQKGRQAGDLPMLSSASSMT